MERLAEFFDEELTPMVRRMAYRPRHVTAATAENQAARAVMWQGLVGMIRADTTRLQRQELTAVAEQLGTTLYQGPLLDTLVAAELLRAADRSDLLVRGAGLALAIRQDGAANPTRPADMLVGTGENTIEARRSFVGFAAEVDHLLVVGRTPAGVRLALTPRDHPTVSLHRQEELGRGELYRVQFSGTPVTDWLGDGEHWAELLATARICQAGYLVGMSQAALDLAVKYARSRRQFGQPIGRFQWVAFRLGMLTAKTAAARTLTRHAARDTDRGADPQFVAAQCLATAAEVAREVTTDALQVHGASGLREESDAQLYYRRAAIEALWWGSPTQLRTEAAPLFRARLTDVNSPT
jgi:alkylation response protein AidB-like acyl-CoA dehydrogenase